MSVRELLRGLNKVGAFRALDEDDVEALIRREFDSDRNGTVELDEFLKFCRGGAAGGGARRSGRGGEEADLDVVSQTYEFSLDPDVRAMEKKLRRAARELAARGGDARMLLTQYDVESTGTVVRSDFVQVLMQLGLSLVDAGGPPGEDLREPGDALRERQMRQLARVRGTGPGPSRARRLVKRRDAGDDADAALVDDWDELALVNWYREGAKRELVKGMLAKSMLSTVTVYPRFGSTCWFEVELRNPFSRAERFAVDLPKGESELRCVASAEEWQHLRRHVAPAFGEVGEGAVEADMIDNAGPPGSPPMVLLMAHETVRVPFAFLSLAPPSHDLRWGKKGASTVRRSREESKDGDDPVSGADRTVPIRFVAAGGYVVAAVEVAAKPRACVVDRTFRFYQAEGEIMKRCVPAAAPKSSPPPDFDPSPRNYPRRRRGAAATRRSQYPRSPRYA